MPLRPGKEITAAPFFDGDVPASETEAVRGREAHVLVGRADTIVRDECAGRVCEDVGGKKRRDEHVRAHHDGHGRQHPPQITPAAASFDAPRAPQRSHAQSDQQQTRRNGKKPGVVVPGEPAGLEVVDGLDAGDQSEDTEQNRERATPARTKPRVERGEEEQRGERNETADEMITGRRARLRLQEAVVDDVQRDDKCGANAEHRLPTRERGGA